MKTTLEQPICKVDTNGTKHWYQNGERHRINGPAIEYPNGSKHWYQNGQHHRIDGPAIELPDGTKRWYLNGKEVTQQDVIKPSPLIMFMII